MQDEAKNSKMLSLFNTLREADKDIVIAMSKSLAEHHKEAMAEKGSNIGSTENSENHQ